MFCPLVYFNAICHCDNPGHKKNIPFRPWLLVGVVLLICLHAHSLCNRCQVKWLSIEYTGQLQTIYMPLCYSLLNIAHKQ